MFTYRFLPIILLTAILFINGAAKIVSAETLEELADRLTNGDSGEDGDPVRVVSDISDTSVTNVLRNTLTSENTTKIAEGIEYLVLKEKSLDPSAWAASKELQQQFTSETLKWAGGQQEGQNGKPPYVTNYGVRGQENLDKVAGSYLFNNKAGDSSGQCNVESSHRVRTAVYNAYLKARQDAVQGGALSCQTEESANSGNHTSLLHKLLGDFANCRDELCQAFEGQRELYSRAAVAEADDREAIRNASGFIPQRVCRNTDDVNGQSRQICEIVTPPSLAADAAAFGLVELPGLSLLDVDEFDEVVSNMMSNLTNQLIGGQNGVLGLSGNAVYQQNVFGEDGDLSYAEALANEVISLYQTGLDGGSTGDSNPIAQKLKVEREYRSIMEEIVTTIQDLQDRLADNRQKFSRCFDLELTNQLANTKKNSSQNLQSSATIIEVLVNLNQQYKAATRAAEKNDILRAFMQLRNQEVLHTARENRELKLTFLNLTFKQWVERFKYEIALERKKCGGSFDFEGFSIDLNTDGVGVEIDIQI